MLRHSFGLEHEAAVIEAAVEQAIQDQLTTADLGGNATTVQVEAYIIQCITGQG